MEVRHVIADIARRTKFNLELIESLAGANGPYEATQLINSMLGLIVFPNEDDWYAEYVPKSLEELRQEVEHRGLKWPNIQTDNDGKYDQLTTVGELVENLRHGIAHYRTEFHDDRGELTAITIYNKPPKANGRITWKATIAIDDLRLILKYLVDELLQAIPPAEPKLVGGESATTDTVPPITRPFRRTFRPSRKNEGAWYVTHPKYAQAPTQYIRAFLLLQKDMQELFDYVEPADRNLACFSYRIHALLLRVCVEFEANCKAILKENGYSPKHRMTIHDYCKIEQSHRLSSYAAQIPNWRGMLAVRSPFATWRRSHSLPWYTAYNDSKHDRQSAFENASFANLIDAFCGLAIILSSQFETEDFAPVGYLVTHDLGDDGMVNGVGGFVRIKFPGDWPENQKYDLDGNSLKAEDDPFQDFDYSGAPAPKSGQHPLK